MDKAWAIVRRDLWDIASLAAASTLVNLVKGTNKLEIPMTARLAPNFELAVAVMNDPRPDKIPLAGAGGAGVREGVAAAPKAREKPNTTAAVTPGRASRSTTRLTVCQRVAPSAREASRKP